ncbi:MAG: MFS transporter [Tannerellaceae bacterium]|jgi:MFS family permease|nr:MFS transporter [Tannerellaceae bacterium]
MEKIENKQQSYNKSFLWMICLVAALGGFLFGIVVGGAKPFMSLFPHIDSLTMKGWGTSSALIGCVLGALLCAIYCDKKWERRPLLITAGALFFLSSIGTALADTFAMYNVYRIVGGVGIGIALNLSPMYIAEMAPSHMRGKLVSLSQLLIMFDILSAQITNWGIISEDLLFC